jgi:transcriptional regulator with XRE-family HTH domain
MSEQFKCIVGMRVRTARQQAGMTQEQLVAAVKRSPMSISKIERGFQLPDLTTLLAIAQAVGKPLGSFVEEMQSDDGRSVRRRELEMRLDQMIRGLSDTHLAVAIEQVEVLVRHRKHLGS